MAVPLCSLLSPRLGARKATPQGAPFLPPHTSQEICLQHRDGSLHTGLDNCTEFSRKDKPMGLSHVWKLALCWKSQAGFLTDAVDLTDIKLTIQSVGIVHRQEGYRLDVGTSLGGNTVFPFESGGQFLQSTDISGRSCRKGSGGLGVSSRMGEASVEELAPQSAESGPGSNPGCHSCDHWSPSPRPFLHASPLPWPMSSTATGSTSSL